ncbi:DUF3427 domain-containing protein [Gracilibacillus massiliensis]|uniref:DUF3427 domain-containing protein n=1 Tax=Gracilibacillus massiliensis TaxID=1564956 RepID=UPI00071E5548|nr:DUF3427 domain-containing protein [Gracilibacillus massiliensis]
MHSKSFQATKNDFDKDALVIFLFVAHLKEILTHALETFRHILMDFNFGELLLGAGHYSIVLSFYLRYLEDGEVRNQEEQAMLNMLYYTIYRKSPEKLEVASIAEGLHEVLRISEMKKEIQAIFTYNYRHLELVEKSHDLSFTTPLRVHSSYSTDQVLAALGYYNEERRPEFREGAIHLKDKNADVFFITLKKSDKDFSPSTMYDDYAMNEWLFHWQSQSRTSVTSETAKRYIHHRERNH